MTPDPRSATEILEEAHRVALEAAHYGFESHYGRGLCKCRYYSTMGARMPSGDPWYVDPACERIAALDRLLAAKEAETLQRVIDSKAYGIELARMRDQARERCGG